MSVSICTLVCLRLESYCFGAVVLTLKATGVWFGLRIFNISDTSLVKGRRKPSSDGSISTDMTDGGCREGVKDVVL